MKLNRLTRTGSIRRLLVLVAFLAGCEPSPALHTRPWRFVVVGDLHLTAIRTEVADQLVAAMLEDEISLVLLTGDQIEGGGLNEEVLLGQLEALRNVMAPLTRSGVRIYPVRGNRERNMTDSLRLWKAAVSDPLGLPGNGPPGEVGVTYSATAHNALFIGLDVHVTPHRFNQAWLDAQLAANSRPHVFVFAHEAAFKTVHADCLDDFPDERDAFWQSLSDAGVRHYFCGHDHLFDLARIDDGDGDLSNDVHQTIVGTGGAYTHTTYSYSGVNSSYTPVPILHGADFGYLLVEISGTGDLDREVLLTWKRRVVDPFSGAVTFVSELRFRTTAPAP